MVYLLYHLLSKCYYSGIARAVKCALVVPFPLSAISEIKLQTSSEKEGVGGGGELGLRNTFLIGFKELSPLIYIKMYFTVKSFPLSAELHIAKSPCLLLEKGRIWNAFKKQIRKSPVFQ